MIKTAVYILLGWVGYQYFVKGKVTSPKFIARIFSTRSPETEINQNDDSAARKTTGIRTSMLDNMERIRRIRP